MPELFNRDNLPNRHAVDELLARPELGPAFEQKFGPGTARYFLGIGDADLMPGAPPAPTDINPFDMFDGPAFNGGRDSQPPTGSGDDQGQMLQQRFTEVEQLRDLDWLAGQAQTTGDGEPVNAPEPGPAPAP